MMISSSEQTILLHHPITIEVDAPPRRANPKCDRGARTWVRCCVTRGGDEGRWWGERGKSFRADLVARGAHEVERNLVLYLARSSTRTVVLRTLLPYRTGIL